MPNRNVISSLAGSADEQLALNDKSKFLDLLWQRTRERGDFPALKRALNSIISTLQDDLAGNAKLTETVLGDFTLTQKVLRLANSPTYAPYAQDVTTVSRALMILGSATVAYTAMNLQLLDTFEGLAAAKAEAAEELAKASFAGKLARSLATNSGEAYGEEAAVATLLYQLPRLLVVVYFPEEWSRIREHLDLGLSEDSAYEQVIGVTPDELSESARTEWSLPHQVIGIATSKPKSSDALVTSHQEWLGCIAGLATELATVFARGGQPERVHELAMTYAVPLGQDPEQLEQLILALFSSESPFEDDIASEAPRQRAGKPLNSELLLSRSLAEVESVVGVADMTTLTQMVLESMMQGLGLAASIVFFRIPTKNNFEARIGFGRGVKNNLSKMSFEGSFVPDVFHIALSQGRAVYLENVLDPKIAAKMPTWHHDAFPSVRSVVLLPLMLNDRAIGLLYGNWGSKVCSTGVTAKEFQYLTAMRNIISKAFEEAAKAPLGAFLLVDSNKAPVPQKSGGRRGAAKD